MPYRLGPAISRSSRWRRSSPGASAVVFLRGPDGRRPVFGDTRKFQTDPHWRDHLLFYEYFHGDNGAGIGASHQTGWTGFVAKLLLVFGSTSAASVLAHGRARRANARPTA